MAQNFKSELKTGAERYLARVVVSALQDGWRTPEDFLRHFKPGDLMQSLEKAPELRATILVNAAGVHERIAKKKSTSSASEDLRISLDEGVTTPAAVLELFPPDDRVRYLDRVKLWGFLMEEQFWAADAAVAGERATQRMTFLLEVAMSESLIGLSDIADGITFETISSRLPLKELQRVVKFALESGRRKTPLSEQGLLEVVPLKELIGHIPLEHVYKRVLIAKVAQPSGFVAGGAGDDAWPEDDRAHHEDSSSQGQAEPLMALDGTKEEKKGKRAKGKSDEEPREPETVSEEELEEVGPGVLRPAAEEEARRKVIDRLGGLQRVPPRHDDLSTPMLLSIESMYADLLSASTDEAREMCIRDSFPNESHLKTALLALIELLDPSIDVNDPVIRDADADSLIKVVLFEERRRYEQGRSPSPAAPGSRRSVPPPLPGRNGSDEKRPR